MNINRITAQPNINDPLEKSIREKLDLLINSEWAKNFIEKARATQIDFLSKSLNESRGEFVRKSYLNLIEKLRVEGNTKIKSGADNLIALEQKPLILIANHIGTAKISRIKTRDIGVNIPLLEEIEPFPIRVAPIELIAEKLSLNLYECAIELPDPLLEVQEKCGVLTINTSGTGRTNILQSKIEKVLNKDKKPMFVMYPEGGTSGKRNLGGPYDLDTFHTGSFVIARNLNLPILPIFQSFNETEGFQIDILEPILIQDLTEQNLKEVVESTRVKMQKLAPK